MTSRHWVRLMVSMDCCLRTAALLTRMWMPPKVATAALAKSSTADSSVTSAMCLMAFPPAALTAATTASAPSSSLRALTPPPAPSAASASAMARPMLRDEPVTIAAWPSRGRLELLIFKSECAPWL